MNFLKITINLFLACILLGETQAQNIDTLTEKLHQAFLKNNLPGLSVALINANGIFYHENFGYADVKKKKPYTASTVQNIGSVSKTFIAVAVMKAVELGYFTLETEINDILPFKVVNPYQPETRITVRELTNHTSGIVDNASIFPNTYRFYTQSGDFNIKGMEVLEGMGYKGEVPHTDLKDFLKDYLSEGGKYYHKENFVTGVPGSTASYSNIGSALAAYLVEIKSGTPFADFTNRYIFKPLHFEQSTWFLRNVKVGEHARPYFDTESALPFYDFITYPDGGLRTSVTDLSKYIVALIKGYNGDSTLLKPESFRAMFEPQFSAEHLPLNISLKTRNKGIFWNLYTNGIIGHDGDDPGVSTFLFFNPKTGLGGVFMTNIYMPDKSSIVDLLVKATAR